MVMERLIIQKFTKYILLAYVFMVYVTEACNRIPGRVAWPKF